MPPSTTPLQTQEEPAFVWGVFALGLYGVMLAGDTVVADVSLRAVGLGALIPALLVGLLGTRDRAKALTSPVAPRVIVWAALVALSAYWSPMAARADEALMDLVFLVALIVLVAVAAPRFPDRVFTFLWIVVWLTAVAFALAALASGSDGDRLSAFGGGPNIFVRIVGLGAIAAVALVWHRPRRYWVAALTLPLLLQAAILSGSRGGVLGLVAATAAIVALALTGQSQKVRRRAAAAMLIGAAGCYVWLWPRVQAYVQERFIDTVEQGYSAGRDVIWDQTVQLWRDHPLAGGGLDSYWATYGSSLGLQHPHNLIAQSFAEAGLAAGVALLVVLLAGFRAAWSRAAGPAALWACAALLVFVSAMFSGSWYDSRFIWLFLILGGEVVRRHHVRARAQDTSHGGATDAADARPAEPVHAGAR